MSSALKLNERERATLRRALANAMQWDASLIDAHRVQIDPKNIIGPKLIPKQYRAFCKTLERHLAAYRRLLIKLNNCEIAAAIVKERQPK